MTSASNSMPEILQAVLCAVVVCAAITDLKWRRIPNWIALGGLIAGLALNSFYGGAAGTRSALLGALLGAALFLAMYLAGGMGAGDVKLFAAVGGIVGPQALLVIFVLTGILGGIAALLLLLLRGRVRAALTASAGLIAHLLRLDWREVKCRSDRAAAGALTLPYGAVVASSTLLFLFAMRQQ